jgi:hypothetical protein
LIVHPLLIALLWIGSYAIAKLSKMYVPRLAAVNFLVLMGGALLLEILAISVIGAAIGHR